MNDEKSSKNNRFNVLVDKLIRDDIISHQSSSSGDDMATHRKAAWNLDQSQTRTKDLVGFHRKTVFSIKLECKSKIKQVPS